MHAMSFHKGLGIAVALALLGVLPGGDALAKQSVAQKCQKAIDRAAADLMQRKLKKLFKCGKKQFKKDQDVASCLSAVGSLSIKKKKKKKIDKKCPDAVITGAPSTDALGFKSCASRATCPAPTNSDTMASCIECSHNFEADCLFRGVYNVPSAACQAP
jgi:hypothetical protein